MTESADHVADDAPPAAARCWLDRVLIAENCSINRLFLVSLMMMALAGVFLVPSATRHTPPLGSRTTYYAVHVFVAGLVLANLALLVEVFVLWPIRTRNRAVNHRASR